MKLLYSLSEKISGSGLTLFAWQKSTGNYLAVSGINSTTVFIYDRHGDLVDEVPIQSNPTYLTWDKDGDILTVLNNRTNVVTLWDANTRRTTQLDSSIGAKDVLTFAVWSQTSLLLAVGNSKGNLLLYNHHTSRKTPIIGKHTKAISCGAFSSRNLLALGSQDQTITVSNADGDVQFSFACPGDPEQLQFAEMKESERSNTGDNTISAIVSKRSLMLINLNEADNPMNLQFQPRYGDIVQYSWYGDGYVLIGFSSGFVVSISTHLSEIGQEIFSIQDHKSNLTGLVISSNFGKCITCGDSSVKVRELSNVNEVYAIVPLEQAELGTDKLGISDDGQLVAVSTMSGAMHVFLTRLPQLGDAFRTKVASLSSLTEITVSNDVDQERTVVVSVELEPSFIGVGPFHVVSGMNNRAWFYRLSDAGGEFVKDREYLGTVQSIKLNEQFAAALFDGKILLHSIEATADNDEGIQKLFPEQDKQGTPLVAMALTSEFLIYASETGHLQYFYLEDWKVINEYRHSTGIKSVHPEPAGTRLIFADSKQDAFLYSPVNDCLLEIPECHGVVKGILWENYSLDKDIFIAYFNEQMLTYILYRDTIDGPSIRMIGSTQLSANQIPLVLYNGQVTCQAASGRCNNIPLSTHAGLDTRNEQKLEEVLQKSIVLKRWDLAWASCEKLNSRDSWKKLGQAAMLHLDVDFATRVYRQVCDVGMVWSLESIKNCEDRNLMAGHLAMFLDKFDLAEKLYLDSSNPICALELRRDLLHWDKALQLATQLQAQQIPLISKEFAQQLEFTGDYSNALLHYEKGLIDEKPEMQEHNNLCRAGIARVSIRLGDIRKGTKLALESQSRALKRDCALILEGLKQFNEAANLYEKGAFFDKAASVFIRSKNWLKVGELLPKVNSPKIHLQYAKAMEADKKYKQAADAYKAAKDYDSVVRILLEHLSAPEEAVKIVRENKSVEGAKLVAKFFLKLGDFASAIQFLVLSQATRDAFRLAEQHGKMDIYADVLGDEGTQEDYYAIADFFETKRNFLMAGKYYHLAGDHTKALNNLVNCGEDPEAMRIAIECVGVAKNSELTRRLIDFLMGEVDGIPKDAKYLFRLYMALQMFREASKVAVIIAREEKKNGNYRAAHDVLLQMRRELASRQIHVPLEMDDALRLVHLYLLAKLHAKLGDHPKAARMLIKVANNISEFPMHTVPILTSAVIECHRSGLKESAFKFAAQLMRSENRGKIDDKYKKKIESVVRKPEKGELEEPHAACPFCEAQVRQTELSCASCKNQLPYCVVTGQHLVKDDFAVCPHCRFPALFSELSKLASAGQPCPMCAAALDPTKIERIEDFMAFWSSPPPPQESLALSSHT